MFLYSFCLVPFSFLRKWPASQHLSHRELWFHVQFSQFTFYHCQITFTWELDQYLDTVSLFFIFYYAWVYRWFFKRCQLTRFGRWCFFLLLKNSRVISFFLVLGRFTIMFLDIWGYFILGFRELFMKIWIFYPLLKCARFFFSFTMPTVVFLYVFFKHLLFLYESLSKIFFFGYAQLDVNHHVFTLCDLFFHSLLLQLLSLYFEICHPILCLPWQRILSLKVFSWFTYFLSIWIDLLWF